MRAMKKSADYIGDSVHPMSSPPPYNNDSMLELSY